MTLMQGERYRSSYATMPQNSTAHSRQQKVVCFNGTSGSLSRQRESVCQSRGLLNAPGENNCFLNSAVQIFWHLDVFRRNFRRLEGHVCLGNSCIFCGIKMLFRQFQESVDTALSPDMLRRALASAFEDQQRFQLGTMHDAAECFENILLRIHYHVQGTSEVANCNDPLCISHRKFAMNLIESFTCNDCSHAAEPLIFSQMVHYVAVKGLHEKAVQMRQRGVKSLTGLFGKLIRKANESGDQRFRRHCNSPNASLKRTLTNQPDIVTIGLAWESEKPKTQTISDVLHTIDTNICLLHLYHAVTDTEWASSAVHHLVGMICYYGRHYSAFFYHSRYQTWMYFDDARVTEIGPSWSQVVAKCLKGHIQPLLLFYANPEFTPLGENSDRTTSRTSSVPSEKLLRNSRSVNSQLGKPQPPPRVSSRVTPDDARDLFPAPKKSTADSTLVPPAGGRAETTPYKPVPSRLQLDSVQRQCSRSSITSISAVSMESYESFDDFRAYAYPVNFSDSKDETDSGCPGSTTSSVEIPAVKPFPTKPAAVNRTHYIQMLLRADDLISSGSLKEDKEDFDGAIRLFEQAAGLLQSCVDPLRSCPQLFQALTVKQTDCCKKLRVLRAKIARVTNQPVVGKPAGESFASRTLPRKFMVEDLDWEVTLEKESQNNGSLRKMHKSRRRAVAKNLGTRDNNRSMPDLTQIGSEECDDARSRVAPPSSGLLTFQNPYSPEAVPSRSSKDVLLSVILQERLRRSRRGRENCSEPDDCFSDLPPPPPELLASSPEPLPEIPHEMKLPPSGSCSKASPCSLCGRKAVKATNLYCPDCTMYMSRFNHGTPA